MADGGSNTLAEVLARELELKILDDMENVQRQWQFSKHVKSPRREQSKHLLSVFIISNKPTKRKLSS